MTFYYINKKTIVGFDVKLSEVFSFTKTSIIYPEGLNQTKLANMVQEH